MYFAMVFFCLAGGECVVAKDTYSPYWTAAQCDARIEEMTSHITSLVPEAEIKSTLCQKIGSNA